jgi:hypothetical protein
MQDRAKTKTEFKYEHNLDSLKRALKRMIFRLEAHYPKLITSEVQYLTRLQGVLMLLSDQPISELTSRLDVNPATVWRWKKWMLAIFDLEPADFVHELLKGDSEGPTPKIDVLDYNINYFLRVTLDSQPKECGLAGNRWTAVVFKQFLLENFNVNYSERQARRIMVGLKAMWHIE